MKRISTVLLISAMSVAVATAQPERSQGPGPGQGGMKMKHRPNPERIMEELDLTPEQRQAMQDAKLAFEEQMIDLRANVQKARLQVRKQMTKTEVNRDELMSAVETEGAADLAIRKAAIDHKLKIRDIVGPEKAKKLHEFRKGHTPGGGFDRDDADDDDADRHDDFGRRGEGRE